MLDLPPTMTELPVTLYVYEASRVDLGADECVQVDELVYDEATGFDMAPYGDLLEPGEHGLELGPGVYHFRLTGDASLSVDTSAVIVVAQEQGSTKDPPLPPPPPPLVRLGGRDVPEAVWLDHQAVVGARRGEPVRARTPALVVTERRRG